jgi:hypothetical protein
MRCGTCISVVLALAIVSLLSFIAVTEGFQGGMSHDLKWQAPWAPHVFAEEDEEPPQNALAWNPAVLPPPPKVD